MVKRSLLLTLALTGSAIAGQISSADFIYTTEKFGGAPRSILEIDLRTKGECKVEPIKERGKEIEVKLINCQIPKVYKVGRRGEFVQGAILKPLNNDTLLRVSLTKMGTLKVKREDSQIKLKIYEGDFLKPHFNIVKTVQGEEIVVELPTKVSPEFNKIGNRFLIKVPEVRFQPFNEKILSSLVKEVQVKNTPKGGLIELTLSPEVAATEVSLKDNSIFITLYGNKKRKDTNEGTVKFEGPKVVLHFTNADVRSVIRAIANIAKKNLVLDPEVRGRVNVDFKNPIYWKDALKAILEPLNLTFVETPEYIRVLPKSKLIVKNKLEPVETFIVPINYVNAEEVVKDLKEIIKSDKRESITYNKDTNTLILKVTRSHYEEIRRIIKNIDAPMKQVMVKAKIVLVKSNASKDLGFSWFISSYNQVGSSGSYVASSYGFNSANYLPLFSPNQTTNALGVPITSNTLALGILNRSQTLRVELALKALELEEDAQTISSPKILTLDNQEATIEQGIEIPYTESTVGAGGATSYNINFKKASLILKVKPHITKDNKIILDLEVRKDSPNYEYVTLTGNNEPAINTRNLKSKVIVENGSTVVIGGIYEKERTKSTSGVPVISKIPLLGWLFRSESQKLNKQQLLIFITPVIVDSKGNTVLKP